MKIIIEGPDGVGKTTLVKKLEKEYNLASMHLTKNDRTDFAFYSHLLNMDNIIFDRHFISEVIYPKVFNRKYQLDREKIRELFAQAKTSNFLIFILIDSPERILARLTDDEHPEVVEKTKFIATSYELIATMFPQCYVIDLSKEDPYETVQRIVQQNYRAGSL